MDRQTVVVRDRARIDRRAGLEEELDDGDAVVALRFDVLDVIYIGRRLAFKKRHHTLFHLFRRQPGALRDDVHHRRCRIGIGFDVQLAERDDAAEGADPIGVEGTADRLAGVTAGETTICTVGKEGLGLTYRGQELFLCERFGALRF